MYIYIYIYICIYLLHDGSLTLKYKTYTIKSQYEELKALEQELMLKKGGGSWVVNKGGRVYQFLDLYLHQ